MRRLLLVMGCSLVACVMWTATSARAQRSGMFRGSLDDPAIHYVAGPLDNPIDALNRRLAAGAARLTFQGRNGYLRSAIDAIGLPLDSQVLVFSNASLQGRRISPANPRAIFFNDAVALGWVRDAELIEVAAQDATQGVVFYTLRQTETSAPRFERSTACLGCHMTGDTAGVPGLLLFSSTPESEQSADVATFMSHAMPMAKRFGGWFVTGAATPRRHKGNDVPALRGRSDFLRSTDGLYDPDGYLASSSDIAALMVFAHQAQMTNRLVQAGWEARAADPALHPQAQAGSAALLAPILRAIADDVVDSLLFIDEARLEHTVQGSSGFAERFASEGPRDKRGRSLRQLDLTNRLLRYPCSYLIYSQAFDALPTSMKGLIYERMYQVLSGEETGARYRAALTLADRQAIVEILLATKSDLPPSFKPVTK